MSNKPEPERADGRKRHYCEGRQALDDIVDAGWGPAFCAASVLAYLRLETPDGAERLDNAETARMYFKFITDKVNTAEREEGGPWTRAAVKLTHMLTPEELVDKLGLPSCFVPREPGR